jgi:hypothetical protein
LTGLAKEVEAALERDDNGILVVNSTVGNTILLTVARGRFIFKCYCERESGATKMLSVGGALSKLEKVGDDACKIMLLCDECQHDDCCDISTDLAKEVKAALEREDNGVLVVNFTCWLFDSISCGETGLPKPFKPRRVLVLRSSGNCAVSSASHSS